MLLEVCSTGFCVIEYHHEANALSASSSIPQTRHELLSPQSSQHTSFAGPCDDSLLPACIALLIAPSFGHRPPNQTFWVWTYVQVSPFLLVISKCRVSAHMPLFSHGTVTHIQGNDERQTWRSTAAYLPSLIETCRSPAPPPSLSWFCLPLDGCLLGGHDGPSLIGLAADISSGIHHLLGNTQSSYLIQKYSPRPGIQSSLLPATQRYSTASPPTTRPASSPAITGATHVWLLRGSSFGRLQ